MDARSLSKWHKGVVYFILMSFVQLSVAEYAVPVYAFSQEQTALQDRDTVPDLSIPAELGSIEESYEGTSGKTIIYIQDAHDSLEAQENIAKLVDYFVTGQNVKTVYEEGYEGEVPTQKFFGFIPDHELKQKVSYFFLDKLRISGAEYAHINRTSDFKLIGADHVKLHLENIEWYKKTAEQWERIAKELGNVHHEIEQLANLHFPKELKEWMRLKKRFESKELNLLDYLKRIQELVPTEILSKDRYPQIFWLLNADQNSAATQKTADLDAKSLFKEIEQFEASIANLYLITERDQKIFDYHRQLSLLERLSRLEVTPPEFDGARHALHFLKMEEVADFVFHETQKSLVFSKRWQRQLETAVRFYKIAARRDREISKKLEDFVNNPDETISILVFGGFHREGIKQILKRKGLSYRIITPKITQINGRHQQYYKQLMAHGHHSFEIPASVKMGSRAASLMEEGDGVMLVYAADLIARENQGLDTSSLSLILEKNLPRILAGGEDLMKMPLHAEEITVERSEMRDEEDAGINVGVKQGNVSYKEIRDALRVFEQKEQFELLDPIRPDQDIFGILKTPIELIKVRGERYLFYRDEQNYQLVYVEPVGNVVYLSETLATQLARNPDAKDSFNLLVIDIVNRVNGLVEDFSEETLAELMAVNDPYEHLQTALEISTVTKLEKPSQVQPLWFQFSWAVYGLMLLPVEYLMARPLAWLGARLRSILFSWFGIHYEPDYNRFLRAIPEKQRSLKVIMGNHWTERVRFLNGIVERAVAAASDVAEADRQILRDATVDENWLVRQTAVKHLGFLRDETSLPILRWIARPFTHEESEIVIKEAKNAIATMSPDESFEDLFQFEGKQGRSEMRDEEAGLQKPTQFLFGRNFSLTERLVKIKQAFGPKGIRERAGLPRQAVEAAAELLDRFGIVHKDNLPPLMSIPALDADISKMMGRPVKILLKDETKNPTGSFKDRAPVRLYDLADKNTPPEVAMAVSTGNHGAAVANAGSAIRAQGADTRVEVYVGTSAQEHKKKRMQDLGADVIDSFQGKPIASYREAEDIVKAKIIPGKVIQIPHADNFVVAGYATAGREIVNQLSPEIMQKHPDGKGLALLAPLGSGGYYSGLMEILSDLPAAKTFGVSASPADLTFRSIQEGRLIREDAPAKIVDGIAATPEPYAIDLIKATSDGLLLVTQEDALYATAVIEKHAAKLGITAEPTSGLPLAALVLHRELFQDIDTFIIPVTSRNRSARMDHAIQKILKQQLAQNRLLRTQRNLGIKYGEVDFEEIYKTISAFHQQEGLFELARIQPWHFPYGVITDEIRILALSNANFLYYGNPYQHQIAFADPGSRTVYVSEFLARESQKNKKLKDLLRILAGRLIEDPGIKDITLEAFISNQDKIGILEKTIEKAVQHQRFLRDELSLPAAIGLVVGSWLDALVNQIRNLFISQPTQADLLSKRAKTSPEAQQMRENYLGKTAEMRVAMIQKIQANPDKEGRNLLVYALDDSHARVRETAIQAAEVLHFRFALPILERLTKEDLHRSVREAAQKAIESIRSPSLATRSEMREIAKAALFYGQGPAEAHQDLLNLLLPQPLLKNLAQRGYQIPEVLGAYQTTVVDGAIKPLTFRAFSSDSHGALSVFLHDETHHRFVLAVNLFDRDGTLHIGAGKMDAFEVPAESLAEVTKNRSFAWWFGNHLKKFSEQLGYKAVTIPARGGLSLETLRQLGFVPTDGDETADKALWIYRFSQRSESRGEEARKALFEGVGSYRDYMDFIQQLIPRPLLEEYAAQGFQIPPELGPFQSPPSGYSENKISWEFDGNAKLLNLILKATGRGFYITKIALKDLGDQLYVAPGYIDPFQAARNFNKDQPDGELVMLRDQIFSWWFVHNIKPFAASLGFKTVGMTQTAILPETLWTLGFRIPEYPDMTYPEARKVKTGVTWIYELDRDNQRSEIRSLSEVPWKMPSDAIMDARVALFRNGEFPENHVEFIRQLIPEPLLGGLAKAGFQIDSRLGYEAPVSEKPLGMQVILKTDGGRGVLSVELNDENKPGQYVRIHIQDKRNILHLEHGYIANFPEAFDYREDIFVGKVFVWWFEHNFKPFAKRLGYRFITINSRSVEINETFKKLGWQPMEPKNPRNASWYYDLGISDDGEDSKTLRSESRGQDQIQAIRQALFQEHNVQGEYQEYLRMLIPKPLLSELADQGYEIPRELGDYLPHAGQKTIRPVKFKVFGIQDKIEILLEDASAKKDADPLVSIGLEVHKNGLHISHGSMSLFKEAEKINVRSGKRLVWWVENNVIPFARALGYDSLSIQSAMEDMSEPFGHLGFKPQLAEVTGIYSMWIRDLKEPPAAVKESVRPRQKRAVVLNEAMTAARQAIFNQKEKLDPQYYRYLQMLVPKPLLQELADRGYEIPRELGDYLPAIETGGTLPLKLELLGVGEEGTFEIVLKPPMGINPLNILLFDHQDTLYISLGYLERFKEAAAMNVARGKTFAWWFENNIKVFAKELGFRFISIKHRQDGMSETFEQLGFEPEVPQHKTDLGSAWIYDLTESSDQSLPVSESPRSEMRGGQASNPRVVYSEDLKLEDPEIQAVWKELTDDHMLRWQQFSRLLRTFSERHGLIFNFPEAFINHLTSLADFGKAGEDWTLTQKYVLSYIALNAEPRMNEEAYRFNLLFLIAMMRHGLSAQDLGDKAVNIRRAKSLSREEDLLQTLFVTKDEKTFRNKLWTLITVIRDLQVKLSDLKRDQFTGEFEEILTKVMHSKSVSVNRYIDSQYKQGPSPYIALIPEYEGRFDDDFMKRPHRYIESQAALPRADISLLEGLPIGHIQFLNFSTPIIPGGSEEKIKILNLKNGETVYAKRMDFLRSVAPEEEIETAKQLEVFLQARDKRYHAQKFIGLVYDSGFFYLLSPEVEGESLIDETDPEAETLQKLLTEFGLADPSGDVRLKDVIRTPEGQYIVIDLESLPFRTKDADGPESDNFPPAADAEDRRSESRSSLERFDFKFGSLARVLSYYRLGLISKPQYRETMKSLILREFSHSKNVDQTFRQLIDAFGQDTLGALGFSDYHNDLVEGAAKMMKQFDRMKPQIAAQQALLGLGDENKLHIRFSGNGRDIRGGDGPRFAKVLGEGPDLPIMFIPSNMLFYHGVNDPREYQHPFAEEVKQAQTYFASLNQTYEIMPAEILDFDGTYYGLAALSSSDAKVFEGKELKKGRKFKKIVTTTESDFLAVNLYHEKHPTYKIPVRIVRKVLLEPAAGGEWKPYSESANFYVNFDDLVRILPTNQKMTKVELSDQEGPQLKIQFGHKGRYVKTSLDPNSTQIYEGNREIPIRILTGDSKALADAGFSQQEIAFYFSDIERGIFTSAPFYLEYDGKSYGVALTEKKREILTDGQTTVQSKNILLAFDLKDPKAEAYEIPVLYKKQGETETISIFYPTLSRIFSQGRRRANVLPRSEMRFESQPDYERFQNPNQRVVISKPEAFKALENPNVPALVYVDYQDLMKQFSVEQREELFAMAYENAEKVRLVIYGAELTDERLKPFRELQNFKRNVWITENAAQQAFETTQSGFVKGWDQFVSLHLSKTEDNIRLQFDGQSRKNIRFFRYQKEQQKAGLLSAALLWKEYLEKQWVDGIVPDEQGYWTVADGYLTGIISSYLADLVIRVAA